MTGSEDKDLINKIAGEDEIAAGNIESKGVFDQSDLRFLREQAAKKKEKLQIEKAKLDKELQKFKISLLKNSFFRNFLISVRKSVRS